MESMKRDMASFFTEHTSALAKTRESATEGLRSLQAEQDCLKQQIIKANEKHSTVRAPFLYA